MIWHLLFALGLAAILPLALITTGLELRRVRLRIVEDLRATVFQTNKTLPQLVLALARYGTKSDDGRPGRQDEVRQWTGAFIYILMSFLGFFLLFYPVAALIGPRPEAFPVSNSVFWLPEVPNTTSNNWQLQRPVAIAGFAFLGGYIFNMRYLIRQTLNQELSALAFVRAALRLMQGVILAIVVFHAGAILFDVNDLGGKSLPGAAAGLAVAFLLGYFPDLGVSRLAKWARIHVKMVDAKALERARIIPLEVIDGIDHEIAFRLQESNLFDVQNLAVANPIELYAETPYTLLQTFDWVLQAQLCLVTGVESFNELKRHKIRTIFDLERAVLCEGIPVEYLNAVASIILLDASKCFRKTIGLSPSNDECEAPHKSSSIVIRHFVAVVSDDLHVHRLRALYQAIMASTAGVDQAGKPLWLFEVGWLPGDPPAAKLAA